MRLDGRVYHFTVSAVATALCAVVAESGTQTRRQIDQIRTSKVGRQELGASLAMQRARDCAMYATVDFTRNSGLPQSEDKRNDAFGSSPIIRIPLGELLQHQFFFVAKFNPETRKH